MIAKKGLFLMMLPLVLLGCGSSRHTGIISEPYSGGATLQHYTRFSSLEQYTKLIGKEPSLSKLSAKQLDVLSSYLHQRVAQPLRAVDGLSVAEAKYRDGIPMVRVTMPTDPLFVHLKSQLAADAKKLLSPVADVIKREEGVVIAIDCHCDNSIPLKAAKNTQQRAEAVVAQFIKWGVENRKILGWSGCEDEYPTSLASHDKKKDRRIEIYICPDGSLLKKVINGSLSL